MTKEEKQLLLQDISARLPYDVKCAGWLNIDNYEDIDKVHPYINGEYIDGITDNKICVQGTWVKTEFVRPYLRPMGSMTEDEKKEFIHCAEYEVEESVNGRHYEYCLKDYVGTPEKPICNCNAIDWLLAHHFDFRGLIEMGLALPAPEGMYKNDMTPEEIREFLKYVEVQHPDGTRTPLDLKDYQLAFLKEVVNNQTDVAHIKRRNR